MIGWVFPIGICRPLYFDIRYSVFQSF